MFWALVLGWKNIQSPDTSEHNPIPISVIVAARNEALNLPGLLHDLLEQNYASYEIILLLDRCTDDSLTIAQRFQGKDPRLRIIPITEVPDGWSPKKWVITQGIEQAQNDLLAFTDADCRMGKNWLTEICKHADKHELVLGLGLYEKEPGLLNSLIQYETLYTAFQYIGAASLGFPYMAVGRNLAYRKSFFHDNEGFKGVEHKLSGDDDLLVNAYAQKATTSCMLRPESHTISVPKKSFSSWYQQKLRHVSASPSYSLSSKLLLAVFHMSQMWFYMGILLTLMLGLTVSTVFTLYIS
ncbi:MAG: glycosyltransferase, partial [Bacteroidota bacterium]